MMRRFASGAPQCVSCGPLQLWLAKPLVFCRLACRKFPGGVRPFLSVPYRRLTGVARPFLTVPYRRFSGRCKALSLSPLSHSLMKVLKVSFVLVPFSHPLIKVLKVSFVLAPFSPPLIKVL